MKGLAVKRVLALMMLWALLFCGCTSTRYSGRYGDGTVYRGIGEEKTFRKFYIRKIEGEGAFVSAVSMSQKHPALFTRSPRTQTASRVVNSDGSTGEPPFLFAPFMMPLVWLSDNSHFNGFGFIPGMVDGYDWLMEKEFADVMASAVAEFNFDAEMQD